MKRALIVGERLILVEVSAFHNGVRITIGDRRGGGEGEAITLPRREAAGLVDWIVAEVNELEVEAR